MSDKGKLLAVCILIILLCLVDIFAQAPDIVWTKFYGGENHDGAWSAQQAADGGYVVVGFVDSEPIYGGGNLWLLKTDPDGDTMWTKTYGGEESDAAYSVQQTSDGGYIMVGTTYSFGEGTPASGNIWLLKTDAAGDTDWTKVYGRSYYDYGWSVKQTPDGGYIITGQEGCGICPFVADLWLLKTDADGDTLWAKRYGGTSCDFGYSVQVTSDSGFIVVGTTYSFGIATPDTANLWLVKIEPDGDTLWAKTYGGRLDDEGKAVQQTSDGGYIITGWTRSYGEGSPDQSIWLLKTDADGDTEWTKCYWRPNYAWGTDVKQTSDGGYIISGYTWSVEAFDDIWLIKTDADGDTQWTKTYGGDEYDQGYSILQTADGGYFVAGRTYSFGNGRSDVLLLKTGLVGIDEQESTQNISTLRCSPNPFSGNTVISYQLPVTDENNLRLTPYALRIYDISGRLIRTFILCDPCKSAGSVIWDGRDDFGKSLNTGLYFLRLEVGELVRTTKMMLLK